ncbi:immunoglobulin domain-containing protein [Yersinia ruckeri]|nr:immunoglobulin domain-containing protein [Yersinia ruckeri]ELM3740225.1 immunoglobulin domain-containing protein [Yersinia ruckeri]
MISVTAQPQGAEITEGDKLSLSVTATASNGTPLFYQWQKDGSPISGATSASYSKNAVASADAGDYQVVISADGLASITSQTATLTLH